MATEHFRTWKLRACAHGMMLLFALLPALLTSQSARANSPADGTPATIGSTTPLEQATDIHSQPLAVLAKFPDAGPAMARYIAQLVAHAPTLTNALLSIADSASPEQASALGAGLVRAMRALTAKQPALAQEISERVGRSDNLWVKTTFLALGPTYIVRGGSNTLYTPPSSFGNGVTGTELGATETRLGAPKQELPAPWDTATGDHPNGAAGLDNSSITTSSSDLTTNGMIVALIGSNAQSNGAVSTSPTH